MVNFIKKFLFKRPKCISNYDLDYVANFNKAYEYTKELGLELPKFNIDVSLYKDILDFDKALGHNITVELFEKSNLQLEDLVANCFPMSLQLQSYLGKRGINSIITSGIVYDTTLNKAIFEEPKETIEYRLSNPSAEIHNPRFHTWITLENLLVVDITLPATLWFTLLKLNKSIERKNFQGIICVSPETNYQQNSYCYKPLFLGYDYFNKVKITPQLDIAIY